MKSCLRKCMALLVAAATIMPEFLCFPQTAKADNPIVQTNFTTDPAPMVYNNVFYIYTGHDKDGADNYVMPDWKCYSSTDMQNWTDHGTILSCDTFSWASPDSAWAAQCIERNGKFYMYVTLVPSSGGGRAIGVAVADSPTGPFKDALGKPLCGPNWDFIDPTVFIDDDGQAYLYFGNPNPYYVKLNENMTSYSGSIVKVNMTADGFGTTASGDKRTYTEGPWFYKRGNLYYLLYAANGIPENICYSTSPSPTGPWTFKGVIMPNQGKSFTNHCGVADYKGKSYFVYHNGALPGGGGFQRSVSLEEFSYNSDGSFPKINMSESGPKQIQSLNPFVSNEAETICYESGIETENCSSGGLDVGNIENGDYIKVKGADFGDGADSFKAVVASNTSGGKIEIHTDSLDGKIIGTCDVPATSGWQSWKEVSCNVSVSGVHDIFFKFTGGSGYLFNVDKWQFSGIGAPSSDISEPTSDGTLIHSTFESSSDSWSGRGSAKASTDSSAAFLGSKALLVNGREACWNGAVRTLGSQFSAGNSYSFSANVMYPSGSDAQEFFLTMEYKDSSDETKYVKIAKGLVQKGKWAQLANSGFTIPADASQPKIYVETAENSDDFYIDEVVAAVGGTEISGADKAKNLIYGDVLFDGSVDAFDAVAQRQGIVKGFGDSLAEKAADVNQSGTVDITDAVLLQKYLCSVIKEFPVEKPAETETKFAYDPALAYKAAPNDYLNQCSKAGKIVKETYTGINGTKSLNVYLPYGYDKSKKYNIFYLMHGGGENENTIFSSDVKLNNILDHMIMNGELEPMIVVTPTFNGGDCTAQTFYKEFKSDVVPFVEGKYSTYAENTTPQALSASRMHRAYGGFSMGSVSTWAVMVNDLDYVGYFMPLSGDHWSGNTAEQKAASVASAIDKSGYSKRQYFIFAATGSDDIACPNISPQIDAMKKLPEFVFTSDFSKGNLYFLVSQGSTHWWGYVRHYIYDALPYFFHES